MERKFLSTLLADRRLQIGLPASAAIIVAVVVGVLLTSGTDEDDTQPVAGETVAIVPSAETAAGEEGAPAADETTAGEAPAADASGTGTVATGSPEGSEAAEGAADTAAAQAGGGDDGATGGGGSAEGRADEPQALAALDGGPAADDYWMSVGEAEEAGAEAPEPPSFDVVRVGPTGTTIIAGRAEPGARVSVLDSGVEIGSARADENGEWVLLLDEPMGSGDHLLSLVEILPDGRRIESRDMLVLSVPGRDGEPTDGGQALAVLVPADGEGPSRALQSQQFDEGADQASQPASRAGEPSLADGTGADGAPETAAATEGESEAPAAQAASRLEDGPLKLESVDYDDKGEMVVSGSAEPGTPLNVYVDEEHIGTVATDEDGTWTVEPEDKLAVGEHRLRVDQVDSAGFVLSRIETPLFRDDPALLSSQDVVVVVQPGNSLWRIARRVFGGGYRFTVIYDANRSQIRDPDLIYPGQIFTIPAPG